MRRFNRDALPAVLVGALVFASQSSLPVSAVAQIKFVVTVDYPLRQKAAYLSWVKSVVPTLQAPQQVKSVASYDNYFGTWPHRFVEFEFNNMSQAAEYFERPEVRNIFEDVVNHGINVTISVLQLRNDYKKPVRQPATESSIKYVFFVDYPLGEKTEYLKWVKSQVPVLQAPEEVKRIVAYDNYFGATPQRFVEFEFDDMEAASAYWAYPEVKRVFKNLVDHGVNGRFSVLELRGDYTKRAIE
jgi:uncharacterized protein (DUF1330 family)